jgi:iron complex transport system permease protein
MAPRPFAPVYAWLLALLAVALVLSAAVGTYSFTPAQMLAYLRGAADGAGGELGRRVFVELRLPRVLLAALTGAVLGLSGALMQGLFRNPIVEPGLAGTSAGAALGAAAVIALGGNPGRMLGSPLAAIGVPALAFAGGLGATMLVYRLSAAFGKVNVFTLLLAGIAVNAVGTAGTGFLSYIARDPQARNIVFWNLGTFTTADWPSVALVGAAFAGCAAWAVRHGKALNALMLGEDDAAYLGIDPERLIFRLLVVNTIMVALATAAVGVIAFVGLIVPHILRMLKSADYRFLLPASALLGAIVMELVDVAARVVVAPAELPVGILTAIVGAPIFLSILLRQERRGGAGFDG